MIRFFRRIGAKTYKYKFTFEILNVKIRLPVSLRIFIKLKRGPNKVITNQKQVLDSSVGKAIFNEKLSINATLYKKPIKDHFQKKTATIKVLAFSNDGDSKLLGVAKLNLSSFALSVKGTNKIFNLLGCIDNSATIEANITSIPIGFDTISQSIKSIIESNLANSYIPSKDSNSNRMDNEKRKSDTTPVETIRPNESPENCPETQQNLNNNETAKNNTKKGKGKGKEKENPFDNEIEEEPVNSIKNFNPEIHANRLPAIEEKNHENENSSNRKFSEKALESYNDLKDSVIQKDTSNLNLNQEESNADKNQNKIKNVRKKNLLPSSTVTETIKDNYIFATLNSNTQNFYVNENQNLTQQISELNETIKQLNIDKTRLENDVTLYIKNFYGENQYLKEKLSDAEIQRRTYENEIKTLKGKITENNFDSNKILTDKETYEKKVIQLVHTISELEDQKKRIELEAIHDSTLLKESQTSLMTKSKENEEFKLKVSSLESTNANLVLLNNHLEENLSKIREQYEESMKKLVNESIGQNRELNEYKLKSDIIKDDLKNQIVSLELKLADQVKQSEKLEDQNKLFKDSEKRMEDDLKNLTSSFRLKEENYMNEINNLNEANKKLINDQKLIIKSDFEQKEKDFKEKNSNLEFQRDEIINALKESQDMLYKSNEKLRKYEENKLIDEESAQIGKIQSLQHEIDLKDSEIERCNEKIEELKTDLERLQKYTAETTGILKGDNKYIEENDILRAQIQDIEKNYKEEIGKLKSENEVLMNSLSAMAEGKSNLVLNSNVIQLQSKIEILKSEKNDLQEKLKNYEASGASGDQLPYAQLYDLVETFSEDNKSIQKENEHLGITIKLLEDDNSKLKIFLADNELKMNDLHQKMKDKNDVIQSYSSRILQLENEVLKSKQLLGDSLNNDFLVESNQKANDRKDLDYSKN